MWTVVIIKQLKLGVYMSSYFGDDRLRHHIVFERKTDMSCVFCNAHAETREHTPSKVFLSKPYPENLSVVPSCGECNNSFSSDELYSFLMIKLLINGYFPQLGVIDSYVQDKISNTKEGRDAIDSVKKYFNKKKSNKNFKFFDARIDRILKKLAICHATHDLSDGYFKFSRGFRISLCCFDIFPNMSEEEVDLIDDIEPVLLFPEIGSIGYEHIFAFEITLRAVETGEEKKIPTCVTLWNEVQDGNYRYICTHKIDTLLVKIVISEFLYAVVIFSEVKNKSE